MHLPGFARTAYLAFASEISWTETWAISAVAVRVRLGRARSNLKFSFDNNLCGAALEDICLNTFSSFEMEISK